MDSATNSSPSSKTGSPENLETLLLRVGFEGLSGTVALEGKATWGPLYLRKGQLFLSKAIALAIIGTVSPEEVGRVDLLPGVTEPGKKRILLALIRSLPSGKRSARFIPGGPQEGAAPFIGPLALDVFIRESRLLDVTEAQMLRTLGGEAVWLKTQPDSSALVWLPRLESGLRRWVSRFAEPEVLGEVVRAAKDKRLALREMIQLFSLGILARTSAPRVKDTSRDSESGEYSLVPRATLANFVERIRESLVEVPIELDSEVHRQKVVEMIAQSGGSTHYELLDIDVDMDVDEVIGPYRRLARWVHPDHADGLSLAGGEMALNLLFERATQAYLVLSDLDRRKVYDLELDIGGKLEERTEDEIAESRRNIAKKSYKEARRQLSSEDYHYAHEYCQIAVKNDPQPDYLALLGEIQSHNPKWLGEAAASVLKALELKPKEPIYLFQLGRIYETMENDQAAVKAFEGVLEVMSNHPGAQEALMRLGTTTGTSSGAGPIAWVRSLLGGE